MAVESLYCRPASTTAGHGTEPSSEKILRISHAFSRERTQIGYTERQLNVLVEAVTD